MGLIPWSAVQEINKAMLGPLNKFRAEDKKINLRAFVREREFNLITSFVSQTSVENV